MNTLDVVVVGVILLSGLLAFARGFVKEALSVAAWLGAAFAVLYGLPYASPIAARFLPRGVVADGAAAIAIFLVALVVLSVVTSAVAARVKESSLSAIDRTLGLIFGLLRGAILACLGYVALSWAMPAASQQQPQWIAESRTLPLLANGAERLRALVPASYRQRAEASMGEARRTAEQVREAAGAMGALSNPRSPTAGPGKRPAYTPDDKRDLNRLIEQQQGVR
jgi:membrane protein required for colicin V production